MLCKSNMKKANGHEKLNKIAEKEKYLFFCFVNLSESCNFAFGMRIFPLGAPTLIT